MVKIHALTACLIVFLVCAHAQTITASLEGFVRDSSGAVVPGAKARIVNTDTNAEVAVETGSEGRFLAPSLAAGPYSVTLEAAGFKRLQQSGIVLRVNQAASVELVLQVGQVNETVEVTGQPPLLEATTSAVGQGDR